jgi:serine/threonine-protein kinase
VVALGGGAALWTLSGSPDDDEETIEEDERPKPKAAESASAPPPAASPLATMQGRWWVPESGRDFVAVLSGDALEFRVAQPSQLAPQDYRQDEPRFVLRPLGGESSTFAVEDRVRPRPPQGYGFDESSRAACVAILAAVAGAPLHARWDGSRLTVEFAKIEPTEKNFTFRGKEVIDCRGLEALATSKVPGVLEKR